jgi:hypothetical protein
MPCYTRATQPRARARALTRSGGVRAGPRHHGCASTRACRAAPGPRAARRHRHAVARYMHTRGTRPCACTGCSRPLLATAHRLRPRGLRAPAAAHSLPSQLIPAPCRCDYHLSALVMQGTLVLPLEHAAAGSSTANAPLLPNPARGWCTAGAWILAPCVAPVVAHPAGERWPCWVECECSSPFRLSVKWTVQRRILRMHRVYITQHSIRNIQSRTSTEG